MASTQFYGKVFLSAFNKEIDLASDSLKLMLLDGSFAPDQNDQYLADISGEAAGTGYTAGGQALTGVSVSFDPGMATFLFDADDIAWTDLTIEAAYAVIYDDTPSTDKPLIAYVDFDGLQTATTGTLTITWQDDGIAAVSVY